MRIEDWGAGRLEIGEGLERDWRLGRLEIGAAAKQEVNSPISNLSNLQSLALPDHQRQEEPGVRGVTEERELG